MKDPNVIVGDLTWSEILLGLIVGWMLCVLGCAAPEDGAIADSAQQSSELAHSVLAGTWVSVEGSPVIEAKFSVDGTAAWVEISTGCNHQIIIGIQANVEPDRRRLEELCIVTDMVNIIHEYRKTSIFATVDGGRMFLGIRDDAGEFQAFGYRASWILEPK